MRAVTKIFVAAQRYISNTFTDQEKQQAIDVFLGTFCPRTAAVPIWQLEGAGHDRSFAWSSRRNYEYCSPRRNRPPDGWWRKSLQLFAGGVQVCECIDAGRISTCDLSATAVWIFCCPRRFRIFVEVEFKEYFHRALRFHFGIVIKKRAAAVSCIKRTSK